MLGLAAERDGGRELENRTPPRDGSTALKRALGLPLLILYGLGVTVGAGIYVLVGAAAAKAGLYAPISFLLAAIVVAFTGFSYAELGARYPVSAGAAAYVRNGLSSNALALAVGAMVLATGVVSAAAISIGAVGYLRHFVDLPAPVLVAAVVLVMGFAAAWGIVESVTVAAVCTAIEVAGLVLVIGFAVAHRPELLGEIDRIFPPPTADAWTGIAAAGLLAFFAFIGFEGIANVAEEAVDPGRTMPRAILATLAIATFLYVAVVGAVVLAVPLEVLSGSPAPLALVFEGKGRAVGMTFTAIAIFATINGVLVQMIMSSRILYGLAAQGSLPAWLGSDQLSRVAATTRTPLVATAVIVAAVLVLALVFPIAGLAETTAVIVLVVFVLVNLALVRLKIRPGGPQALAFRVPVWIPAVGALSSTALLCADFLLD